MINLVRGKPKGIMCYNFLFFFEVAEFEPQILHILCIIHTTQGQISNLKDHGLHLVFFIYTETCLIGFQSSPFLEKKYEL